MMAVCAAISDSLGLASGIWEIVCGKRGRGRKPSNDSMMFITSENRSAPPHDTHTRTHTHKSREAGRGGTVRAKPSGDHPESYSNSDFLNIYNRFNQTTSGYSLPATKGWAQRRGKQQQQEAAHRKLCFKLKQCMPFF